MLHGRSLRCEWTHDNRMRMKLHIHDDVKFFYGEKYMEKRREVIREKLHDHRNVFCSMENDEELLRLIDIVAEKIISSLKNDGKVLLCGNGGSAADAQHIAAEFVGRFQRERMAYDAEALTTNTSILTAIANDYEFNMIFSRQVEAKGRAGDVLIGISTSGKSENVLKALECAKKRQIITVMLMGDFNAGQLVEYCDYIIKIPSKVTARIQEGHIFIGHIISELVEMNL